LKKLLHTKEKTALQNLKLKSYSLQNDIRGIGGLPDGIVVKKINGFWHACTTSDPRGQPEKRDSILSIGEDVRAKADLPYWSLAKSKGKLELTPMACQAIPLPD